MVLPYASARHGNAGFLAYQRVRLTYVWRHHRLPHLHRPTRFTELVQQRKLHNHDPALPIWADKVAAKALVSERLGAKWVTPTLWQGERLPDARPFAPGFVVKARHGCNQVAFVRTGDEDWASICAKSARWMKTRYGYWLDEWLYGRIPRGLLIEPFIGSAGAVPVDYKFYVFGGRVAAIQVHLDRENRHVWLLHDRDWRRMSCFADPRMPQRPRRLDTMIDAAETLGAGFDFVRVDLYDLPEGPRFGEMTFYPGSGLDPFDPDALDRELGALWRAAQQQETTRLRRAA